MRTGSILMLGQLPPPIHGQAVMISVLESEFRTDPAVRFVQMRFSHAVAEVGKASARKYLELCRTVLAVLAEVVRFRPRVVYYPPTGTGTPAVIRDIILLTVLRALIPRVVLHLHALGQRETIANANPILAKLWQNSMAHADCCICIAQSNVADISIIKPRWTQVIPYGVPDVVPATPTRGIRHDHVRVLYVGNLVPGKGLLTLLDALELLRANGTSVRLEVVGGRASDEFDKQLAQHPFVTGGEVRFSGVLEGAAKWAAFERADVFCFPTHYESENFPVVLLEAMMFSLPTVATQWRGIPEIVDNGVTGLLVPPKDSEALSEALLRLVSDYGLRVAMGAAGRAKFERKFSSKRYALAVKEVLVSLAK